MERRGSWVLQRSRHWLRGAPPAGWRQPWVSSAALALLAQVRQDAWRCRHETGRAVLSETVLSALANVPREHFVEPAQAAYSYLNRALPIACQQTISQPYIVALMTDLLDLSATDRVLEVGTGSGYQSAVLAPLVGQLCTIEIIPELAVRAAARLRRWGYGNILFCTGDGYRGWDEGCLFEAIIVTAAVATIPPRLLAQLRPGGRMVLPLGAEHQTQQLLLVTKRQDATLCQRAVLPVRFVPLTGRH
ncbi:protein-L-isoaspartate(D-aspartate) O-methyltransferase [Sinobacterium caligoides]|uniref:Protein-L-isoaspartate O-methyltransferase n=1 Tax=Sinobacterium caligoides TaxID=933926 RepID=A0A3N2DR15_9GAMM|nr:protein-L-isoaspartate(D-aspartate) O-methyltransferase [Sinobacterium caligoides]ROS02039.1 protein-L-isoaspartate(D-aspartate) O-methyltransferase [Sinobacterium caligoides]